MPAKTTTPESIQGAVERMQLITIANLEAKLHAIQIQKAADLHEVACDLVRRKRAWREETCDHRSNLQLQLMERNVRVIAELYRDNKQLMDDQKELSQLMEEEERVQAHLEESQRSYAIKIAEARECAQHMEESFQDLETLIPHFHESISDLEDQVDYLQECCQAEYRTKLMYSEFTACILEHVNSSGLKDNHTDIFKGILTDSIRFESVAPRLVTSSARTA